MDTYARDNIKDYKKLSSPAQSQIRRIIEDGRAKGVSDSDVLACAKVAAHSGLDIVFSKEETRIDNPSTAGRSPSLYTKEADTSSTTQWWMRMKKKLGMASVRVICGRRKLQY